MQGLFRAGNEKPHLSQFIHFYYAYDSGSDPEQGSVLAKEKRILQFQYLLLQELQIRLGQHNKQFRMIFQIQYQYRPCRQTGIECPGRSHNQGGSLPAAILAAGYMRKKLPIYQGIGGYTSSPVAGLA
jgi:hypothetical protein